MRLICPNCGAQYEVPDDVIPAAGRDVQCSNCGNTWFEQPGQSVADEDDDARITTAPPVPAPEIRPAPAPAPEPERRPVAEDAATQTAPHDDQTVVPGHVEMPPPDDIHSEIDHDDDPDDSDAPPPTPARDRLGLDPNIAAILREEADREQARRTVNTAETFDSQPDLAIDQGPADDPETVAVQRRMARLRGDPAAGGPGARKSLLPDIEEINSSLSPSQGRGHLTDDPEVAIERQRGGFRLGFVTVLVLAGMGTAVYSLAGPLGDAVPSLAPALEGYANWVDGLRLWLDLQMQGLLTRLNGTPTA